jgi:hypothetical protein
MNSKNKKIRDLYTGINHLSSNLVKDECGDLLADSHNILNRCKNYFSQLLNVHRLIETLHTAKLLVLNTSPFDVEIDIAKFKKYKLPGKIKVKLSLCLTN